MRLTCSCFQSVSIDWSFVFTYIILAKYNRNKHVWDVCIESYYHYLFVCLETKINRKSIGNLMVTMSFDWDVEWKELIFCVAFQKDLFPFFNGIKLNTSNISMNIKCKSDRQHAETIRNSRWKNRNFLPLNKFLFNSFLLGRQKIVQNFFSDLH